MRSLPNDLTWKVLSKLCKQFDESISNDALRLAINELIEIIRSRDIHGYVAWCKSAASLKRISKLRDASLREIRMLRLLTCFIKYQGFTGNNLEVVAFQKFIENEARCEKFNTSGYFSNSESARFVLLDSPVRYMREFISAVCGKYHSRIFDGYQNGPGASIGRRGIRACEALKQLPPYSVNKSCKSLVDDRFRSLSRMKCILDAKLHDGFEYDNFYAINEEASLEFVPKDATSLRTITIGNTVNVGFQLAVSEYLRRRLNKLFGINLFTQEHNQTLAKYGSIDGSFATIDLSNASDTLSLGLLNLFPLQFAEAIYKLREHKWKHQYLGSGSFAKISAMGNGLTFTLQSIIYASIVYAACRMNNFPWCADVIAIHGDDIVVPDFLFFDVCYLLKSFGMSVNTDKTFYRNSVRESCGHDYFKGERVDRFTVKEVITNVTDIIKVTNSFKAWGDRYDIDLSSVCQYLIGFLEKKEQFYGPNFPEITYEWIRRDLSPFRPFYHKDFQRWFYSLKRYRLERPTQAPMVFSVKPTFTPLVGDIPFRGEKRSVFGKWSSVSHFFFEMKNSQTFSAHMPKFPVWDRLDELLVNSDVVADCLRFKEAVTVKKERSLLPFEKWARVTTTSI